MALTETIPSRRRSPVSKSLPVSGATAVEQLDAVVAAVHEVNRSVPRAVLGREELIALAGLLTQVSGALQRLTELLAVPTAACDRVRRNRINGDGVLLAVPMVEHARVSYRAAYRAARTMHHNLKVHSDTRSRPGWGQR